MASSSSEVAGLLDICEEVEVKTGKKRKKQEDRSKTVHMASSSSEIAGLLDINCEEVEVKKGKKRKKQEDWSKKQQEAKNKGPKKQSSKKGSKGGSHFPLFTEFERRRVAQYDLERIKLFVADKVSSELFAESFPERAVVWEQLQATQLEEMIKEVSQRLANASELLIKLEALLVVNA